MKNCQQILAAIAAATTTKELRRLELEIIPAALIKNDEQGRCHRAVVLRLAELNNPGGHS